MDGWMRQGDGKWGRQGGVTQKEKKREKFRDEEKKNGMWSSFLPHCPSQQRTDRPPDSTKAASLSHLSHAKSHYTAEQYFTLIQVSSMHISCFCPAVTLLEEQCLSWRTWWNYIKWVYNIFVDLFYDQDQKVLYQKQSQLVSPVCLLSYLL